MPLNRVKENVVEVHTLEDSSNRVEGIFEFSSDLELKNATFSDQHRKVHRRLEAEKKITHSYEDCPERYGPLPVRAWDSVNGWRDLKPDPLPTRLKRTNPGD